jgi:hypothetical protein
MIAAIVAPPADRSIATTFACLVPARALGTAAETAAILARRLGDWGLVAFTFRGRAAVLGLDFVRVMGSS